MDKMKIIKEVGKNLTQTQLVDLMSQSVRQMIEASACNDLYTSMIIQDKKQLSEFAAKGIPVYYAMMVMNMARVVILAKAFLASSVEPEIYEKVYIDELNAFAKELRKMKK